MSKLREIVKRIIKEETSANLESSLKKYIKSNQWEIDQFLNNNDWDGLYEMLENDFPNVDIDKLQTAFNKLV